ncbi:MAG: hydrogenase iron-sulfur subunit [Desulfobacterales bacterium]|nr:hydrogenase iron-sulfur subunit [Desulfobacterales bacterium]
MDQQHEVNIIVFLCSWNPHAAFQAILDQRRPIPTEIKMVRIPCSGRINKTLLFKSFAMSADGVAVIGCPSGSCRYGLGTQNSEINVHDTRAILDLLGIRKDRLKMATFFPDQAHELLTFLNEFRDEIVNLGKSRLKMPVKEFHEQVTKTIPEIINQYNITACIDCGKCTSACPLALVGRPFSPRAIASATVNRSSLTELHNDIFGCLTCGICEERCPSNVRFPEFIKALRHHIWDASLINTYESHAGFLHALMRFMAKPEIQTNRWGFLPKDIRLNPDSKILFFGGCAPYYDVFFHRTLEMQTTNILTDSIRLLNFFDIYPTVLDHERCCGHDLLWSGDAVHFRQLAKLTVDAIHEKQIDEVIVTCPECYHTLVHDYAQAGFPLSCKVTHLYDVLEREIDKGSVKFKPFDKKLTYQDSCRLTRFSQKGELTRKLINRLNVSEFTEMAERGLSAMCCGNSAWIGCNTYSKALQVKRLRQAKATGTDIMVTSCPKCQMHLRCAMEDPFIGSEISIELVDLTHILAQSICWE